MGKRLHSEEATGSSFTIFLQSASSLTLCDGDGASGSSHPGPDIYRSRDLRLFSRNRLFYFGGMIAKVIGALPAGCPPWSVTSQSITLNLLPGCGTPALPLISPCSTLSRKLID